MAHARPTPHRPFRRLSTLALLCLLAVLLLGARCRFTGISIDAPAAGLILDAQPVAVLARLASSFDSQTVEVRLDGVDLIDALGLTPPFSGQGGVVNVGGDLVTVANFTFNDPDPGVKTVSLELSDLDTDEHLLEVEGVRLGVDLLTVASDFTTVDFFTQELELVPAAGLPGGPEQTGEGGSILANATLGDPLAGPPIAVSDGGEIRSGFVEAAEGRIAGAGP